MTTKEYLLDLRDKISERKQLDSNCNDDHYYFSEIIDELLTEKDHTSGFRYCNGKYTRDRLDMVKFHIDAISLNEVDDNGTIEIYCLDYVQSEDVSNWPISDVRNSIKLAQNFIHCCVERDWRFYGNDASEDADVINKMRSSGQLHRVKIFIISNREIRGINNIQRDIVENGIKFEYAVYDIRRLNILNSTISFTPNIDVDFENDFSPGTYHQNGIRCIENDGPQHPGLYDSKIYIGVMPGKYLAELYQMHGQRLMMSNLRAYLQEKGNINKGIKNTSLLEPDKFLAYNNGICCTADMVETQQEHGVTKITKIGNLQIVNGGQTTATLYKASITEEIIDKNNIEQIFTPFKLIVISPKIENHQADIDYREKAQFLVSKVSEYSNSQNAINSIDLKSNNYLLKQIEALSRETYFTTNNRDIRYYYERVRGAYKTEELRLLENQSELKNFKDANPVDLVFTTPFFCQLEMCTIAKPWNAAKGAQTCFSSLLSEWNDSEPVIDELYYHRLVGRIILYRKILNYCSNMKNTLGARRPIAYYTMAWLMENFGKQIDFLQISMNQRLPHELAELIDGLDGFNLCERTFDILKKSQDKSISNYARQKTWTDYKAEMSLNFDETLTQLEAILLDVPQDFIIYKNKENSTTWKQLQIRFQNCLETHPQLVDYTMKWLRENFDGQINFTIGPRTRISTIMNMNWNTVCTALRMDSSRTKNNFLKALDQLIQHME